MTTLSDDVITGFLIHDISRIRKKLVDAALANMGLTRSQRWALAYLALSDHRGLTQVELANRMNVSKASVGKTLKRLVESGFVQRTSNPDDLRVKRASMTPAGEALVAKMDAVAQQMNDLFLEGISAEQKLQLRDCLTLMMENLMRLEQQ